jgi:hypothetical protein
MASTDNPGYPSPNADYGRVIRRFVRQEWPVYGGRLVLTLETERAATPEQFRQFGLVVAAIETSGFLPNDTE